jgi:methylenetetrahydrofolate dehydrogenase (NADP+)/methenyltetrahydrofolate cyclohydrolase
MAGALLEGKPVAEKMKVLIQQEVAALKAKCGRAPKLLAIQIGENASSAVYVKNQKKTAESLGIEYELKTLPDSTSQGDVERLVQDLNKDRSVTAVILQLPVPKSIDPKKIVNMISPEKDAEGMHPQNIGRILLGNYTIGPCTAMAVMELLESAKVDLYGK